MTLLALYGVLVLAVWSASTLRGETTLLRGSTVFGVHVFLLAAQAAWLLLGSGTGEGLPGTLPADPGAATGGAGWGVLGPPGGSAGPVGFAALGAFAVLTAASLPLRRVWLLSAFEEARFRKILELSLRQLRMPFEREAGGYALTLRTGRARITCRRFGARRALLRFESDRVTAAGAPSARSSEREPGEGDAPIEPADARRDARKLDLLRALLAKRFGRLVPRPRIRFE